MARLSSGDLDEEEQEKILVFLRNSTNADLLPEVEDLWIKLGRKKMPQDLADRIFDEIVAEGREQAQVKPIMFMNSWKRVAAVLFLISGMAALFYQLGNSGSDARTYVNKERMVKELRLQDGTVVYLNSGSSLKVPELYGSQSSREVWLEGEAFFSVAHNREKPFLVHAPGMLDVKVLGTRFNVKTKGSLSTVVLTQGSVQVMITGDSSSHSEKLSPGEMAIFDPEKKSITRTTADTLYYTAWRENLYAFRHESLQQVAEKIGNHFGYEIVFDREETGQLLFSGYLSYVDLEKSISTLEETFKIKIVTRGRKLFFRMP